MLLEYVFLKYYNCMCIFICCKIKICANIKSKENKCLIYFFYIKTEKNVCHLLAHINQLLWNIKF